MIGREVLSEIVVDLRSRSFRPSSSFQHRRRRSGITLERRNDVAGTGMSIRVTCKAIVMALSEVEAEFRHGLSESGEVLVDDDGKLKRTVTVWATCAHIITASIGAGVLSLAWAMTQLGWLAGIFILLFCTFAAGYASTLLADCYRFPDPVSGKRNYFYMEAVKVYLDLWMDVIHKPCYHWSWLHYNHGKKLAPLAMSFVYATIGIGLSLAKIISVRHGGKTSLAWVEQSSSEKIWMTFIAAGDIAFACLYALVLFDIQDTLKSTPPENKVMKKAVVIGGLTMALLFTMCGSFGYAAFGNKTPEHLLAGFGDEMPWAFWLLDLANFCIVVHIVGAFQVLCQPVFRIVELLARSRWPKSNFFTKENPVRLGNMKFNLNMFRLTWRTFYVVVVTVIAMAMPFFTNMIALLGAIGYWPLIVYVPIEMHIAQNKIQKLTLRWFGLQLLSFLCLLISLAAASGSIYCLHKGLSAYKLFQVEAGLRHELSESGLNNPAKIAEAEEELLVDDDGKLKRTGTVWTGCAHIITTSIGAGVLSLAWAMAQLGLLAGIFILLFCTFTAGYAATLLADCYRFPDPVLGKRNYSYMEAVKKSTCHRKNGEDSPCMFSYIPHMVGFALVEILLSQLPNFHKLTWLSKLAAIMGWRKNLSCRGGPVVIRKNLDDVYSSRRYCICLLDTLKSSPAENKVMKKVVVIGGLTMTVFFMMCSSLGYAAFGNKTPENLLAGFGDDMPWAFWLLDIANFCIVVHIVGAFQVLCQPVFRIVEVLAGRRWPKSDFVTKENLVRLGNMKFSINMFRLTWRTSFVVLATVIAMAMPFFTDMLALLGAIGYWPLIVYIPIEMHIVQNKIQKQSLHWFGLQLLSFLCFLLSLAAASGSIYGLHKGLGAYKLFQAREFMAH
ncbi:hypothetical protein ACLB2K_018742 [Fragaria x ananassa]